VAEGRTRRRGPVGQDLKDDKAAEHPDRLDFSSALTVNPESAEGKFRIRLLLGPDFRGFMIKDVDAAEMKGM